MQIAWSFAFAKPDQVSCLIYGPAFVAIGNIGNNYWFKVR
jgi:hypothetical protein